MTRVLMTADTVGGVWTYALELAGALAPHGVEVHLATMGPPMSPAQRTQLARSAVASTYESEYALEWMPDPWADVRRAGDWLLDVAREVRPDVVHLNGYAHAALPWPAPVVVVAHSCVLSWWWAVHGEQAPASWRRYERAVRRGLHAADAVVAPTSAMLAELGRWYGYAGGEVVPNCRRAGWLRDVPKEPFVVGSGRVWDGAKNLVALHAVAGRVGWPVVIAGPIDAPGGGPAVMPRGSATLLGPLAWEELAGLLLRASVYVAPARYEPFGLGALEAAQAGCALVLGDIPSLREVWGDAAVYVDPHDADALAATLHGLVMDGARVESLAVAARDRARRYSPQATALGYLGVYERLPASTGSRR